MRRFKKVIIVIVIVLVVIIGGLFVCVSCSAPDASERPNRVIEVNRYVKVVAPSSWEQSSKSSDEIQCDIPGGGMLQLSYIDMTGEIDSDNATNDDYEKIINDFFVGIYQSGEFSKSDDEKSDNHNIKKTAYVTAIEDLVYKANGTTYRGVIALGCRGTNMGVVMIMVPQAYYESMKNLIYEVADSLQVNVPVSLSPDSSTQNSSSTSDASTPSGGDTGSAVDSAKEAVKSKIKTIVNDNYKDTKVSSITVNDDAGSSSGFIVIVNLTWDVKNTGATSKKMLSMYSEDLAARVGESCSNVNEIAVCWDVPYLKASAKVSYKRSGSGMAPQDQTWDKEFN